MHKEAPPILVSLIGAGIEGSPALGTAALIARDCNLQVLSEQTDRNISHLHSSMFKLEGWLKWSCKSGMGWTYFSLGGDLCMALGETCCFYAKHSGVIKETLTKVKENLFTREEERK